MPIMKWAEVISRLTAERSGKDVALTRPPDNR